MVAIVSGEGLGLSTSSLSTLKAQGRIGDAQQGRGNDRIYLNIANGNLVIQSLDEHLAGPGLSIDSLRTYNSQGQLNGEYLDSPLQPTRLEVQGGLSSANSRITRIDDQGHSSVYIWDASRNAWLNTDGDDAYDSIGYDKASGTLTWTDGSSGVREIHQRVGDDWMLMSRVDADGNRLDFSYDKYGRLISVINRNGEGSWYDYSGTPGNTILTQVRTLTRNGAGQFTSVRVRYGYDSLERITSITVDLSPDDASVADGRSYVTRYEYEGSSNRISAVYQDDGSVTRFGYIKLGSDWRIASFSNALGQTTRIDYQGNSTWVTDPLGLVTRYDHDDAGQLLRITAPAVNGQSQITQFAWNGRGDLVQMTDARGLVTTMQYDANGNQVYVRDGAGNVLTRQYSAQNLLLSETVYLVPDPDGAGSAQPGEARTTQYVYDGRRHLRFVISAEGRVTEYRYNATGQRISQFAYAAVQFNGSGARTEIQMAAWAATQDPRQMLRTDWVWDFRGQLQQQRTASALDASGAPAADSVSAVTLFVYDRFGLLLQTIFPEGGVQANAWDGLGRLLSSTDALGNTTLTRWDDRGNRVSVQAANGLLSTSVYDRAGRLLAQSDSNPQGQLLATTTYRYDADGRLISVQDPTGVLRHLLYDAAGRQVGEIDGRGALTQYRYGAAGQLLQQTNSRGQDLRNEYDTAGRLLRETDVATQTVSEYGYDAAGNRILERTIQAGLLLQDNRLLFDAQNRMREVSDSAHGLARVRMAYDAMGNRIRIDTDIDSLGVQQHSTGWYAYDAMNRQILVNGVAPDQAGSQGRVVQYDLAGRRVSETWVGNAIVPDEPPPPSPDDGTTGDGGAGEGTPDENPPAGNGLRIASGLTTARYSYDDQNRLTTVLRDGVLVEERHYDAAGRLTFDGAGGILTTDQIAQLNAGVAQADQSPDTQTWNTYDSNGQLRHVQTNNADGSVKSSIDYFYDDSGRVTSYQVHVPGDDGYTNTFTYAYDVRDSDLVAATYGSSTLYQAGASYRQYDANGYLTGITDQANGANNRSYVNDARGIPLEIRQGNAVQRQLVANGEVLGRYGTGPNPVQGKDSDNNPIFATGADLNFTWQVLNGQHPGTQPGSYTVTAGDSLQSIARQQYGDSRLWYLIADANGLSASTALQSGQKLNLPSILGTSADRADTFKPYDASQLIGDTTPTMPPPPPDDGGCGVLGLIVVVVVAVVVTIATSGAAAPEAASMVGASTAGAASASITASGYFATGLSTLAGEYGVGTAIVAGAVGGAAGSIASQLVGIGLGVQDGFSWSGVALGAISTAVGGGLAKFVPFEGAVGSLSNTVARTALGNVVTQGIGVVAGLQSSFSWTSVAASAVGSGVGWEVGDALGTHASAFANAEFTERLMKTGLSGFAAAAITAVARGGRIAVQQVAVDAFGNALGNSLVATDWSGTAREAVTKNAQPVQVPAAGVDAGNVDTSSYWDAHPMLYAANDILDPLVPRVMTDAAEGSSILASSLAIPKTAYQPEDFPNQSGPLRDQYDLSNPANFSDYLNAVNQLKANGVTLDPQDVSTSKALLFHYYGYRMGELRGTADQLAGSLNDQISPAYTRALQAFNRADAEERQDRYDFYSNIRPTTDSSGNLTRGRYVDMTQDGRTIRVNWDRSFADTAAMVGVSADEALRKTDFSVYGSVIDAAFSTNGLQSISVNGAWRPSADDYRAVNGDHLPPGFKNWWSSAHVVSDAVDINSVNGLEINGGTYRAGEAAREEPVVVRDFIDNLASQRNSRQLFSPWQMSTNISDPFTFRVNRGITQNEMIHENHIHFGTTKY